MEFPVKKKCAVHRRKARRTRGLKENSDRVPAKSQFNRSWRDPTTGEEIVRVDVTGANSLGRLLVAAVEWFGDAASRTRLLPF